MDSYLKISAGAAICVVLMTSIVLLSILDVQLGGDIGITFEDIDKGEVSGYESRDSFAITDNQTWSTVWTEMQSIYSHPDELPPVDFSREFIVAVFRGACPSGGYWTEITNIILIPNSHYIVHVEESLEGGATTVMTYPYHIVKISDYTLGLPVLFEFETVDT